MCRTSKGLFIRCNVGRLFSCYSVVFNHLPFQPGLHRRCHSTSFWCRTLGCSSHRLRCWCCRGVLQSSHTFLTVSNHLGNSTLVAVHHNLVLPRHQTYPVRIMLATVVFYSFLTWSPGFSHFLLTTSRHQKHHNEANRSYTDVLHQHFLSSGLALVPVAFTGIDVLGTCPELTFGISLLRANLVTRSTTGVIAPRRKDTRAHDGNHHQAVSQLCLLSLVDARITDGGTVAYRSTTL